MNYATPQQVVQIGNIAVGTKLSERSAFHLLKSGMLADLFKAGLTENGQVRIARKTFQRFLGVENPEPDAILTLAHPETISELTKDVPCHPTYRKMINDKNFPYRGRKIVLAETVSFPWKVSLQQAIEFAKLWYLVPLVYEDAFVWAHSISPRSEEKLVFAHEPAALNKYPVLVALNRGKLEIVDASQEFNREWEFVFARKYLPGGCL